MDSIHSRREKVKIKTLWSKVNEFSHLSTLGGITLKRDTDFSILCFIIKIEDHFSTVVHLWPSNHPSNLPKPDVLSIDDGSDDVSATFLFQRTKNDSNCLM